MFTLKVESFVFDMPKRLTQEEVIRRFREVHGDYYDYSKVVYVNNKTKVCIICPIHGEFWLTPEKHLCGIGCKNCRGFVYDRESFIKKAMMKYGDRYDYSKVVYINSRTKVCIICPVHGEFWQRPNDHLTGYGCPECGKMLVREKNKKSLEEFIRQARLVHGDFYDYSKVVYIKNTIKVCIVCPIHGEFWQTPISHLNGHGCQKCVGLYRKTTEDFINDARKIHGDRYDYSKVEYVNNTTPVCIICPIHGEFWQTPKNHLKGMGCRKCYNDSLRINRLKPFDKFVAESKDVHGDKYIYVEETYKRDKVHTKIICPDHGEFWQTPNNHLHGYGCPYCRESHGERDIRIWLDEHNIAYKREFCITPTQVLFGRNKFLVDFYLPDYNTFIEFNGSQHYKRAPIWHTEEQFQEQQDRDRRLREYCKQHKIRLIEIPYTEFDNIDKILSKKIKV